MSSETFLFGGSGSNEPEIRGIDMKEPQGMQMVTGDSQCRGKLFLLTKLMLLTLQWAVHAPAVLVSPFCLDEIGPS